MLLSHSISLFQWLIPKQMSCLSSSIFSFASFYPLCRPHLRFCQTSCGLTPNIQNTKLFHFSIFLCAKVDLAKFVQWKTIHLLTKLVLSWCTHFFNYLLAQFFSRGGGGWLSTPPARGLRHPGRSRIPRHLEARAAPAVDPGGPHPQHPQGFPTQIGAHIY